VKWLKLFTPMLIIFVALLLAWPASAWSPTIRQIDQTEIDGTDCCILRVYCDAPRGNIVYLARSFGTTSPTVAVIHQPEVCK